MIASFTLKNLNYIFWSFKYSCSWNKQDGEIEYVEGYDELEEEDDIEDLGGRALDHSHADDDNGRAKF